MCVEALHALAGAADAAVWRWAIVVISDGGVAIFGVCVMGCNDLAWRDLGFGPPDPSRSLHAAYSTHELGADKVIASRHRGAIVKKRGVPYDDRVSTGIADSDIECASRWTPEQFFYSGPVVFPTDGRQGLTPSAQEEQHEQ